LVLNIAREEKVSMTELETISGSGNEGRVTKRDILNYVANRSGAPLAPTAPHVSVSAPAAPVFEHKTTPQVLEAPKNSAPAQAKQSISLSGGDEVIEMDRMRKLIADHMVMSKHTSPHVTSFVEADVTNMVIWRDKMKKVVEKREGEKMTFTPIFIECVVKAIKDYPMINVSVDGTNIIKRKAINIGMAAALPSGNLIVPVIKNADGMNLLGLTKSVNDYANRARANQLKPDEISGGTFTLTNVGGFGNIMGTPIINQPQVAIMATGAIKKKPAVLETEHGDVIAIRHMMFLSLSYDHRVVDGSLGGSFLRKVADYMEQWDVNREM
jgi:2-oxoglutarate dehydrogenase E2 component (dihydrolipoamide succinyltransferase)